MKSPLHDIPTERHREGQLDRAARVAELSNCHLLAIDGSDTLDGCRAGIAGDGLLVLGIRDRPRALGVMISRAARTARAYLRASLLTVGRKTRGLNFLQICTPEGSGLFELAALILDLRSSTLPNQKHPRPLLLLQSWERLWAPSYRGPSCVSRCYTHPSDFWLPWLPRGPAALWNVKHWNKLFQAL